MADLKYRTAVGARAGVDIDQGLRSYMLRVYNYMALGVAVTAIVTLFVAGNPAVLSAIALGPAKWILFFAILGLGFMAPRMIFSGNAMVAQAAYWGYAALWGVFIAPMIAFYMGINGGALIVQALGLTAVTFGATSLAGYVTKRDLSGLGGFFMMASIGLILAIIANAIFFHSTFMSLITSMIVVVVFAAVTAYETQMIKQMYVQGDSTGVAQGKAIFGAFMLYGAFITLFIHILNILGIMRSN